jgi:hypothetical protein
MKDVPLIVLELECMDRFPCFNAIGDVLLIVLALDQFVWTGSLVLTQEMFY